MKKILNVLTIMILIFIMYVVQLFVLDNINLFGVKINLLLIFVIIISSWFGMVKGTICGFFIGFIADVIFGSPTFMFTINYTLVGMLIGFLNINYTRDNKLSVIYITLLAVVVFEILQYIHYIFLTGGFSNILYFLKQIIFSSILNMIIIYVIYCLIHRVTSMFESKTRRDLTGL